jgi:hypothetical protein
MDLLVSCGQAKMVRGGAWKKEEKERERKKERRVTESEGKKERKFK